MENKKDENKTKKIKSKIFVEMKALKEKMLLSLPKYRFNENKPQTTSNSELNNTKSTEDVTKNKDEIKPNEGVTQESEDIITNNGIEKETEIKTEKIDEIKKKVEKATENISEIIKILLTKSTTNETDDIEQTSEIQIERDILEVVKDLHEIAVIKKKEMIDAKKEIQRLKFVIDCRRVIQQETSKCFQCRSLQGSLDNLKECNEKYIEEIERMRKKITQLELREISLQDSNIECCDNFIDNLDLENFNPSEINNILENVGQLSHGI